MKASRSKEKRNETQSRIQYLKGIVLNIKGNNDSTIQMHACNGEKEGCYLTNTDIVRPDFFIRWAR